MLGNSIPPEYARKGYQIVDTFGRVVKDVPPALTPEQIAEQERLKKEKARQEELARQQEEADRTLLRLYSHPGDARRARDRRLQELDALINLKRKKIEANDKKIVDLESRAADAERAGKKVPEQILHEIERLSEQKSTMENEIQSHQKDRNDIVEDFDEQIERLEYLMKQLHRN
ncbi:ABC transporter ATPase [Hahella sp. CCB-MM4]|uniref:ABC transporter ATPase n=1 Tax=Hahella sp. (strain CCB-MM4) TaxID=1926491 RepID=UPI001FEE9E95|nr:ABC transporter ATPase [Hahella sp. CCB-MM4]